MTDTLVRWLQGNFNKVPDVRRASSEPDASLIFQKHHADLVVSTWMGAKLYLYLIRKPPKVKDIKNILKENSRDGIGTLFLINRAILPASDTLVRLTDWQEALMVLNDHFIYAYAIDEGSASIIQVHYASSVSRDEYRVWQLNDFGVENVSVRKRDVQGNVRGTWFVGDIASPAYKRRMNYERVNQRYHYSTKYTQELPGGRANGQTPRQRQDELSRYYLMLGVDKDATEQQIKSAFRRIALQVHPDVSALPRPEANRRFQELHEAYEFIKDYHGWS